MDTIDAATIAADICNPGAADQTLSYLGCKATGAGSYAQQHAAVPASPAACDVLSAGGDKVHCTPATGGTGEHCHERILPLNAVPLPRAPCSLSLECTMLPWRCCTHAAVYIAGARTGQDSSPAYDQGVPRQLLFGFGTLGVRRGCDAGGEQLVLASQEQQQRQEEAQQRPGAGPAAGAAAALSARSLAFQRRPAAPTAQSAKAPGPRTLHSGGLFSRSAAAGRPQQAATRNPFSTARPAGAAGKPAAQQSAPCKQDGAAAPAQPGMGTCSRQQEQQEQPEAWLDWQQHLQPDAGSEPAGRLQTGPNAPAPTAADLGLTGVHITPAKRSRQGSAPLAAYALSPPPAVVRPVHNKQVRTWHFCCARSHAQLLLLCQAPAAACKALPGCGQAGLAATVAGWMVHGW
jgi:hypothetical protein